MKYYKPYTEIFQAFLNGETEGRSGSPDKPVKHIILGDQLHYLGNPILERCGDGSYILNMTRYDLKTLHTQRHLKEIELTGVKYRIALNVPKGYQGSLAPFAAEEEGER